MNIIEQRLDYIIPKWAVPVLINDDSTGINESDNRDILIFLKNVFTLAGNTNFIIPHNNLKYEFKPINNINCKGADCTILYIYINN